MTCRNPKHTKKMVTILNVQSVHFEVEGGTIVSTVYDEPLGLDLSISIFCQECRSIGRYVEYLDYNEAPRKVRDLYDLVVARYIQDHPDVTEEGE